MGLYNLSGKKEEKWLNRWLRSIGEAPVIYSPFLTEQSKTQLQLYLNNKGYYKARVTDSVWFKKKKAYVEYRVVPGPVTKIGEFDFQVDSVWLSSGKRDRYRLVQMILNDSANSLVKKEMPLDVEVLEDERERIAYMLRKNGYFNFSKNLSIIMQIPSMAIFPTMPDCS